MNDLDTATVPTAAPALAAEPLKLADTTANPAPLGLLAFGLTTVMLSLHNAGLFGLDAMILAMAVFYGGIAQIFAGVFEWRKNNTFAATAFISYGFFWLTLVGIIVFPKLGLAAAPGPVAMASYLGIWGLLSLVLFFGTLRLNRALQLTFLLLTLVFALLAIGDLLASPTLKTVAGRIGVALGFCAIYTGLAQVINEVYGRIVLPLGQMKPAA
jgi:succinate-acetate transporter protein